MASYLINDENLAKTPGQGDDTLVPFVFTGENLDWNTIPQYEGWGNPNINDIGVKFVATNLFGGPDYDTVGSKSARFMVINFQGQFGTATTGGYVKAVQVAISLTQGIDDTSQNMPHAFYIRFKYYSSSDWLGWYGFG